MKNYEFPGVASFLSRENILAREVSVNFQDTPVRGFSARAYGTREGKSVSAIGFNNTLIATLSALSEEIYLKIDHKKKYLPSIDFSSPLSRTMANNNDIYLFFMPHSEIPNLLEAQLSLQIELGDKTCKVPLSILSSTSTNFSDLVKNISSISLDTRMLRDLRFGLRARYLAENS